MFSAPPLAHILSAVMCMKWNRNSLELNLIVLLFLAAFCISLFPWIPESSDCFHPQRFENRVLILDAGHGGEDGGAVSVTGTPESGINLAIALKMQQLCGLFGVDVVMTREEDASLKDDGAETLAQMKRTDLKNRVKLIESTDNSVLISIHQNYFSGKNHGAQVFFAPTEDSEGLAQYCQQLMVTSLDPENHRLSKQITGDIYLMNHISCPAILVECGFLSNQEEAQKLEDGAYQTKIALTVLNAYMTYPFQ